MVALLNGEEVLLVRVGSHRACAKLKKELGRELKWFYTFPGQGNMVEVSQEELARVRAITGVTLARPKSQVYRCW